MTTHPATNSDLPVPDQADPEQVSTPAGVTSDLEEMIDESGAHVEPDADDIENATLQSQHILEGREDDEDDDDHDEDVSAEDRRSR